MLLHYIDEDDGHAQAGGNMKRTRRKARHLSQERSGEVLIALKIAIACKADNPMVLQGFIDLKDMREVVLDINVLRRGSRRNLLQIVPNGGTLQIYRNSVYLAILIYLPEEWFGHLKVTNMSGNKHPSLVRSK